jgi:NAD(P)-dependent dehydrogenase (short-subunit alcohol dehydrogenase family)
MVATFRMVKALRDELAVAVGVTAKAGPCGWQGQVDPAGAGVAGFLKSLAHEAEAMLVKVVDVERPASRQESDALARTIAQEIAIGGRRIEVAYRDGLRLAPRVVPAPLDLSAPPLRQMSSDSVILAFGGSRGVTAAVVKELARRYRPRLVLIGTRPLPDDIDRLARLDPEGRRLLKQTLTREWKERLKGIKPIEIERKYRDTLLAIEAYETIRACEASGASVRYEPCDVRDEGRVREVVQSAARTYSRIDGVIFGAGTIEDKLIEDKTPESFARVFGIKAEGIFNVCKALEGIPLSFLAAFSSVAGRFGNRGQGDYAAANEVLSRFIGLVQAARPETRCVSLDWTGWSGVGLAARSGVIEVMEQAGFEALAPDDGARIFHEEIRFASGPTEIVIASAGLPVDRDGQMVADAGDARPFDPYAHAPGILLDAIVAYKPGAWLSARTTLEPSTSRWLRDHVINGAPLMPAVFGIEMMVEAASRLFPGLHLLGVRDLRLHLAVKVLRDRPTLLKITAVGHMGDTDDERLVRVRVTSDFAGPDGRTLITDRVHYTCDVRLGTAPPVAAAGDLALLARVSAPDAQPRLYGDGGTLPHGPAFQVIERVDGLDAHGVVASVAALDERLVFPDLNGHHLHTLPFAREAAFQSAGLWGMLQHGIFGLPHGCRALHHFGQPPAGTRLRVQVAPTAIDTVRLEYDIDLVGDDGRMYDRMEGFYTVNPVAAAEQGAEPATSGTPA